MMLSLCASAGPSAGSPAESMYRNPLPHSRCFHRPNPDLRAPSHVPLAFMISSDTSRTAPSPPFL